MSWITNKATLVSALEAAAYYEVSNALDFEDVPETEFHKHFILRAIGANVSAGSSNTLFHQDTVRLEVGYIIHAANKTLNEQVAIYFEAFRDLVDTIKGLSGYRGFIDNSWSFERANDSNHQFIGRVEFYYGAMACSSELDWDDMEIVWEDWG